MTKVKCHVFMVHGVVYIVGVLLCRIFSSLPTITRCRRCLSELESHEKSLTFFLRSVKKRHT